MLRYPCIVCSLRGLWISNGRRRLWCAGPKFPKFRILENTSPFRPKPVSLPYNSPLCCHPQSHYNMSLLFNSFCYHQDNIQISQHGVSLGGGRKKENGPLAGGCPWAFLHLGEPTPVQILLQHIPQIRSCHNTHRKCPNSYSLKYLQGEMIWYDVGVLFYKYSSKQRVGDGKEMKQDWENNGYCRIWLMGMGRRSLCAIHSF